MHFFSAQHNLLGGWAIVGGHIALAVGVAFGMRYRSRDDLVLCIFGDGATNQGYFHESLNMAALWRLPVVLFCENNLYGMGGAVERVSAVTAMARKACAYDIPAQTVDGMDVAAVYRACMQAVEHVRSGRGPYFIEAETYRFRGHSMADPGLYRTKEEEQQWRQRDPIERLRLELGRTGALDDAAFGEVERRAAKAVDEAVRFAESSPAPDISELTRYTYAREAEHG
jgi:pyruvate dehydrogenase E1 component alpha subunit